MPSAILKGNTPMSYEYAKRAVKTLLWLVRQNIGHLHLPLNTRQILWREFALSSPGPEFCCDYPSRSYLYLFTGVADDETSEHRYIELSKLIKMSTMLLALTL